MNAKEELTLGEFGRAIENWGEVFAQTMMPIIQRTGQAIQELHRLFWQVYLNTGAPYGETEDGMMRWYKEIGEARRLQIEADRILSNHRMLAEFRKVVNERQRISR